MSWTWGVAEYFDWSPLKYIPGYQDKGLMDNWTILMGANDRTTLLGPSITFNMGASYSTSYDVAHMLLNSLMNKLPPTPFFKGAKNVVKGVLGNGDIKLVLGPSTSLLYGGPAGSSKRGPYWDRIAGTWWDPRGKGAKYSAEGSFSPGSVGKGSKDGLQFFERDQIFGEEGRDGYQLAVLIKSEKRQKIDIPIVDDRIVDDNGNLGDIAREPNDRPKIDKGKIGAKEEDLNKVKLDKYDSDLKKCYTTEELIVLEQGDKAAKYATCLLLLIDVGVTAVVIFLTKLENTAKMTPGTLAFSQDAAQKAYDTAKEADKLAAEHDLVWIKKVMLARLIYKVAKIIGMQIMEIFENTERLARLVITNVDTCKDVNLEDYAKNKYLSAEKRLEITQKMEEDAAGAILAKILADKKARLGWTAKQIKLATDAIREELAPKVKK